MRYLITGGAGFIGSHLAEALLAEGHAVDILDDLSTGSIRNLEAVRASPRLRISVDSVFHEPLLAERIDEADVVFHLAAAVGVFQIVESPVQTIRTNIHGTELVLKHAGEKKKVVLLASTSEVYGKSNQVPFSEEDDCVLGASSKGRWSYACSKLIDEFLALSYWKEHRLPTIVVRLFNTVGPRQTGRYGMVLPRFVQQALSGGPITIFGDGQQSRCFCAVEDVVPALLRLTREPSAYGHVFNLGSDEEITIEALARMIRDKVDPKIGLQYVPYDQAYEAGFEDMRRRIPELAKIRARIGYRPTLTTEQIVDRVIAYYHDDNSLTAPPSGV